MGKSDITYFKDIGGHVWNPITGCSGKGCAADCYAKRFVKARPAMHGYDWEGDPIPFNQVVFHESRLSEPLRRKKPTVYGVGFFGDMFDEQVKFEWIKSVLFQMYGKGRHHTYVLLTKHPDRMAQFFSDQSHKGGLWETPLENVFLGVTVCTQADMWRVEELLKVPGKKWISYEPALEPIWFGDLHQIDCLVIGCESGAGRRSMPMVWATDALLQARQAGIDAYVKQLDINGKVSHTPAEWPEGLRVRDLPWRNP